MLIRCADNNTLNRYRNRKKKEYESSILVIYTDNNTNFLQRRILLVSRKIKGIRGIVSNIFVIRNRKEEMIIT